MYICMANMCGAITLSSAAVVVGAAGHAEETARCSGATALIYMCKYV